MRTSTGTRLSALLCLALLLSTGSAEALVQRSILIDGNMQDWQGILVSPGNSVIDKPHNQGDLDLQQSSLGTHDLRRFAVTWDETYLYLYFKRTAAGSDDKEIVFLAYIDLDYDGQMGFSDGLLAVRFTGDNQVEGGLYQYIPSDLTDPMDGDGANIAGFGGAKALTMIDAHLDKDTDTDYELRISWTDLTITAGRPVRIQAALGLRDDSVAESTDQWVTQLPLGLKDNCDVLDTGELVLGLDEPLIVASPSPGVVHLKHEVESPGNILHAAELSVLAPGARVNLFSDPDRDGNPADGTPLAVDVDGDGRYTDPGDSLFVDTTGDLLPDSDNLLPGETFPFVARITLPAGLTQGSNFEVTITSRSSEDEIVSAFVVDTVRIGNLTLTEPFVRRAAAGTQVTTTQELCNNTGAAEDITLAASAPSGWTATVDPENVTLAAGTCVDIDVYVTVPVGAAIDDVGSITTLATFVSDPLVSESLTGDVIVTAPLTLLEDRTGYGLAGTSVFYPHVLINATDTDLDYSLSWFTVGDSTVVFWSDPDGDGKLGDGQPFVLTPLIDKNGGEYPFIVEIQLAPSLDPDDIEAITITATTASGPNLTAQLVDETTIRLLASYGIAPPAQGTTIFNTCADVYVQGAGLDKDKVFRFQWYEPSGSLVRISPQYSSGAGGRVEDVYSLWFDDPAGVWRVELYQEGQGGVFEIVDPGGSTEFVVRDDLRPDGGLITLLAPSATTLPPVGGSLSMTTVVDNSSSLYYEGTAIEYTIYHDDDGDLTPDVGEPYIQLDGSAVPWSNNAISCRSFALPLVSPGQNFLENGCSIGPIAFGQIGAWAIRAQWKTPCLGIIAERTTSVNVGCFSSETPSAGSDRPLCSGDSTQLGAPAIPGLTYSWSPSNFLDDPTSAQPWASPPTTIAYTMIVTDANGCSIQDDVLVLLSTPPAADAGPSEGMCVGDSVVIGTPAEPDRSYQWSPATGLDNPTSAQPTATPATSTNYTLTVTDLGNSCASDDTVAVNVNTVTADPGPDVAAPVVLGPAVCVPGHRYDWTPSDGLDDPASCNPFANPLDDTTYCLTVTDLADGCASPPVCAQVSASVCGGLFAVQDLRAVRRSDDVELTWTSLPAAAGGYHGYRDDTRAGLALPPSAGQRIIDTAADPLLTLGVDPGALLAPEPLFFYRLVGVCTDGVTEGP